MMGDYIILIGFGVLLVFNAVFSHKVYTREIKKRNIDIDDSFTLPYYTENMCETIKGLKNNSKNVFVLEHPMDENCVRDVVRVSDTRNGSVVLFGLNKFQSNIFYLDHLMISKKLVYFKNFVLPEDLAFTFTNYKYRAYVSVTDLKIQLDDAVRASDFGKAVSISKAFEEQNMGEIIKQVVVNLLKDGENTLAPFAYKLWESDAKEIVKAQFPKSIDLVLSEQEVLLVYKKDYGRIRLTTNFTKQDLDRDVFTDCTREGGKDLSWKFVPVWSNNNVNFKIWNLHYQQWLKIQQSSNSDGSRTPWSGTNEWYVPGRFIWSLVPVRLSTMDAPLYCFINIEHNQALTSNVCSAKRIPVIAKSKPCSKENAWHIAPLDYVPAQHFGS